MERAALDDYIRTARIVTQGPLHRGGGHPDKQLALLEGGIGVVVKIAVAGDPVKQAQVRAERAAAVLACALGWEDLVPATAFRVVESLQSDDYVAASVQVVWPMFLPAVERQISPSSLPDDEIWRAALFDALALNTDRHGGNWGTIEGMDQHPRLIDHGHAFEAATSGGFDFINERRGGKIPDSYRATPGRAAALSGITRGTSAAPPASHGSEDRGSSRYVRQPGRLPDPVGVGSPDRRANG